MQNRANTPPSSHPKIKHIIAVASGKGGVGKSSVCVQLAHSLTQLGKSVGIMDADIYGPSIGYLLGASGKPEINDDHKMLPHKKLNIVSNSMAYLIDEGSATSWRGPMATKALWQLFFQTAWPDLDVLLIDMPPGTGDIQLSLASKIPTTGALLVTTPQDIALLDVRKAADFFHKVNIPLLGIVENMSYYQDKDTDKKHFIFGQDGGKKLSLELKTPLLATLPIDPAIAKPADNSYAANSEVFKTLASTIIESQT